MCVHSDDVTIKKTRNRIETLIWRTYFKGVTFIIWTSYNYPIFSIKLYKLIYYNDEETLLHLFLTCHLGIPWLYGYNWKHNFFIIARYLLNYYIILDFISMFLKWIIKTTFHQIIPKKQITFMALENVFMKIWIKLTYFDIINLYYFLVHRDATLCGSHFPFHANYFISGVN